MELSDLVRLLEAGSLVAIFIGMLMCYQENFKQEARIRRLVQDQKTLEKRVLNYHKQLELAHHKMSKVDHTVMAEDTVPNDTDEEVIRRLLSEIRNEQEPESKTRTRV